MGEYDRLVAEVQGEIIYSARQDFQYDHLKYF